MPFTDEQPFLDAIAARHHDDGLRFIYADFLEDSGDAERAELVRIQVALARMTEDHPRRAELANREADLLAAHRARWSEHLRDFVLDCEFRRGVLDSIAMDAAAFLAKGDELFHRVALRRIRLRDSAAVVADLVKSPLLARVRELDLCDNNLGNAGVALLTRSPHLHDLEALDLGYNGIDDGGVHTLSRASAFPRLASLSLSFNREISSAGAIELAMSPFLAGLTALDLSSNAIDETGLHALLAGRTFQHLHTLRISENRIGDAGVAAMCRSELLERMLTRSTRLDLRDNRIGPAGAAHLAAAPRLARCLALDLTRNAIEDQGLAALVESEHLRNLRVLKVGSNQISDNGIVRLRQQWPRVFEQFRAFDVSDNRLTNYGINQLKSFNVRGLVALDVTRNVQTGSDSAAAASGSDRTDARPAVDDVAAAAELRHRVSHPSQRPGTRPNPPG